MPKNTNVEVHEDMTEQQIVDVFTTLRLPTVPAPVSAPPPPAPVIFYPITGNSPPVAAS